MRAGLPAGRVLTRFGDVSGPVVNLAARLTSLARPGTALVGAELAAALRRKADTGCSTGGPWQCPDTTICRGALRSRESRLKPSPGPTHSAVIGTKSTAPGGYVGSA